MPISEVSELQNDQAREYVVNLAFDVPDIGMPSGLYVEFALDTTSQEAPEVTGAFNDWMQDFLDHMSTFPTFRSGTARKNLIATQDITVTEELA
jgi:hypothetical protein